MTLSKTNFLSLLRSNAPWIILWLIGFGLFLGGMPKYNDDVWYMAGMKDWYEAQGISDPCLGGNIFTHGIPLDAIRTIWGYHYLTDNFRLVNILAPFLLLLPKWLTGIMITLLLGHTVILAARAAGYDWLKSPVTPLVIFLITFFFPWSNNFGVLVYQLNYILPTWLGIIMFQRLRHPHKRISELIVSLVIGLVLGWCHEALSIPILIGLIALFACYKSWRRADVVLSMVGLILGILLLLSSPNVESRASGSLLDLGYSITKISWHVFPKRTPIYFIMLVVLCASAAYGRLKRLKASYVICFSLFSATASVILAILTNHAPRVLIWSTMASIIGLLKIIHINTGSRFNSYNTTTVVAAIFLLAPVYTHLVFVDIYTFKFRDFMHENIEPFPEKWETGFFVDDTVLKNPPPLCLDLPDKRFYESSSLFIPFYHTEIGVGQDPWTPCFLISRQLEYVTADTGSPAGEGSPIRTIDGLYFIPADSIDIKEPVIIAAPIYIDLGNGPVPADSSLGHFISRADGKEYYQMTPKINWYLRNFKTIRGMWLRPLED